MLELNDSVLLKEYVEHGSEEAFATLVARHVNKVYSIALRHTRNAHQAEEITQAVFVILARKSRQLGKRVILSGWLCRTARLSAVTFARSEIRRTRREQEAHRPDHHAAGEPGRDVKKTDEAVLAMVPDRTNKIQAPEPLVPTNRFGSADGSIKHFVESRATTEDFLKTATGMRDHVTDSPLGKLDGYEFVLLIAAHSERHTKQINEVKADPDFPKK